MPRYAFKEISQTSPILEPHFYYNAESVGEGP